jgi:predicted permease
MALGIGLRLVASPLMAIVLAGAIGLSATARDAGLVESAMPTAVATTVLAEAYEVDPGFITGAVLLSTVLSPITLTPLLAWLGVG